MRILPADKLGRIRLLVLITVFCALAVIYRSQCAFLINRSPVLFHYFAYHPQEGDIIFQSLPHGSEVDVIEGITHSPFSHCGVVLRDEKKHWSVIEAIYNVHQTPLFLWMLRGREGSFTVYRLNAPYASRIPAFKQRLINYTGRFYDFDYNMADDRELYCSDLIYLAFKKAAGSELGKVQKLDDLDWRPYQNFIRAQQGGNLPLFRVMITPAALALSPQLHQVYPKKDRILTPAAFPGT